MATVFWPCRTILVLASAISIGAIAHCATSPTADPAELPRIPPLEPDEALSSFRLRPGFRIELVAAEPLIRDPIEICFDENGRLFVVEMIDYSELRDAQPHLGRIRLLEDTDADGRFDQSRVYAEDLPWPTGVFCWDDGIFVAATPDLLYLKDTDGDGRSDTRSVVLTGFASDFAPYRTNQLNMQAMLNSLRWGLDNRIHGATGPNGGAVHPPSDPTPINLRGRDFAFDPRALVELQAAPASQDVTIPALSAEAGGGQYGLCFDDRGRRFTCNNSDHIRVFMADARYAARNPWFVFPPLLVSIAADGPSAKVFRTSPEEPWRVLRTQWRVAGLVPGPIEGGGRSSGYFTSATGITIYRGDAWPDLFLGDAFIADCGSNLIHRKKIHADGVVLSARRADDEHGTEFLTCSDVWFRPVQFANAPDGTLYVIDMYREIIEHPWSLPPGIKQHLDLNSGNDRGRVYRIVPDDFKPRPPPRLGRDSTAELVQTLAHPNAWHRETAARLIYTRQDRANAQPALEQLLRFSNAALGRLHALYALDGLAALAPHHLALALADPDDRVREHAVRLSERWLAGSGPAAESMGAALIRMMDDPSPQVRYQLAFTLGEFDHTRRVHALAAIAHRDIHSPWTRAAVLSSIAQGTGEMFEQIRPWFQNPDAPPSDSTSAYAFLRELVEVIGTKNSAAEVNAVLEFVQTAEPAVTFTLVHALGQGLQRARSPIPPNQLEPILETALRLAVDRSTPELTRIQAIELLGLSRFADSGMALLGLLRIDESQEVQSAALRTAGRFADPAVTGALVNVWPVLTPRLRQEMLALLLARPDRINALLAAVEARELRRSDFSSVQLDFLMNHRDPRIRAEAVRLLAGMPVTREELLARYRAALELPGDPARGRHIFVERCASCHRLGGEGYQLGPDLASVRNAGKEKLLIGILDPNSEVLPQYLAYEVETRDEESLLGLVISENAASVTLRQAYARDTIIFRDQILGMRSRGTSIMPEALESDMSPQDMANLLEFLATAAP
jgi:putative membrane-bound dehydrogenase-like protein